MRVWITEWEGINGPIVKEGWGALEANPTPYTLHLTPYTLHPTPYNLHTTPYTLHPTPHTLHPTLFTEGLGLAPPERAHLARMARLDAKMG